MQKIRYTLCTSVNIGSLTEPKWEDQLAAVDLVYSEENLAIAQSEAYEGIYEIVEVEETEDRGL